METHLPGTRIRAILFDSDGVLVDTERLFFDATRAAFRVAGFDVTRNQWAAWYLGHGKRSHEVAALIGIPPARVDAILTSRDAMFRQQLDQGAPLFPAARKTLQHLARRFRLAVVTGASRDHFERAHAASGLRSYFETIVTADDCAHLKPHPEAYQTGVQRLGLTPAECLAVEDSPRGAAAAVAAGIRCVVIPTPLTDLTLVPSECTTLDSLAALATLPGPERFTS